MSEYVIRKDDLSGKEIADFLEAHLEDMRSISPPESKHALDIESLKNDNISFWTLWQEESLLACGALKLLSRELGEIKSMRTDPNYRGRGLASIMLKHMISQARELGLKKLNLETGSMKFFKPAHQLYSKHGFKECAPFADYQPDENSIFMELNLD